MIIEPFTIKNHCPIKDFFIAFSPRSTKFTFISLFICSCDLVINIGDDDGKDVTTEFVFAHRGMLHSRPQHSLANLSRTTTSFIQDHNAAHRKCSLPCRNEGRSTLLRRGENRITRIALAIVWLFLFCHSWKLVPTFYELIYSSSENWPSWLMHVNDLSHSFIVLNSAVNFLLYTVL